MNVLPVVRVSSAIAPAVACAVAGARQQAKAVTVAAARYLA
jgi:hypothetical protein